MAKSKEATAPANAPVTTNMFAGLQEQIASLSDVLVSREHPEILMDGRCLVQVTDASNG